MIGGSSTSFVKGPLNRSLPASLTSDASTYIFPVGAGSTYLPYAVTSINTGAIAPVLQVTAFATNSGGTPNALRFPQSAQQSIGRLK